MWHCLGDKVIISRVMASNYLVGNFPVFFFGKYIRPILPVKMTEFTGRRRPIELTGDINVVSNCISDKMGKITIGKGLLKRSLGS